MLGEYINNLVELVIKQDKVAFLKLAKELEKTGMDKATIEILVKEEIARRVRVLDGEED